MGEKPYTVILWRDCGQKLWEVRKESGWVQRFDDKDDADYLAAILNDAYKAGADATELQMDDRISAAIAAGREEGAREIAFLRAELHKSGYRFADPFIRPAQEPPHAR